MTTPSMILRVIIITRKVEAVKFGNSLESKISHGEVAYFQLAHKPNSSRSFTQEAHSQKKIDGLGWKWNIHPTT